MRFPFKIILFSAIVTFSAVFLISCNVFSVNYNELKVMEGKWKITKHSFVFYYPGGNILCDTTLYNTGIMEFHQSDEYGGTFTFTPTSDTINVVFQYYINALKGNFELTDLQTSVDIYLHPESGGLPIKNIKVIDYGKRSQVWYADRTLNNESGSNETMYVEKIK